MDGPPHEQTRNGNNQPKILAETRLSQEEEDHIDHDTDPDAFRFYSPELEPLIPRDVQERAKGVIESLIEEVDSSDPTSAQKCCSAAQSCCEIEARRYPGDDRIPSFTPLLKEKSNQGLRMMASFISPSLPRLFRDLWVVLELAVTIYQFVLACVSLVENRREVFNIVYIALASAALLLSLVDFMFYCIQLGSCVSALLYCRSKLSKKPLHSGYSEPDSIQSYCLLSKKWRKRFDSSLEFIRNIVTELILYPLLICDMFDFISFGSYRRRDMGEKINFSLFIVGGFYLVLSVYLARMLMIAFSLYSLRRIPKSANHTQPNYVNTMTKFSIHILGQLAVSVVIIVAVGVKIRQENSSPCDTSGCIRASGYLIYAIIAGGLIPLLGIFSFFLTNIYNIRLMSVSLWVDMVSMLQGESFTSVVFAKEGLQKAKDMAHRFTEKAQLAEVKKQLKTVSGQMPSWAVWIYPLRFPIFWIFGLAYLLLLLTFISSLFLSVPEEDIESDFLQEGLGLTAIIAGLFIVVTNLHFVFLMSILIVLMAVIFMLVLMAPVFIVLGCILYIPLGCCFGCLEYLRDMAQEMSIFSNISQHPSRIRAAIQQTRSELRK